MLDARRRAILRSIGIDVWRARSDARVAGNGQLADSDSAAQVEQVSRPPAGGSGHDALSLQERINDSNAVQLAPPALDSRASELSWDELREAVAGCRACGLHQTRTQTVFGVGDRNARLMVIGEAPGADEDRQGEPFVGRAGQLLNAMLEAIGLAREQVYIANIIKCRPPGNRDPHAEEAATCQPYLHRQIALIEPTLILSVGRVSAHNLLGTEDAVGRLRGRVHRFEPGDVPLVVTYHPAYLLRRPQEKAKAWQDLQLACRELANA